MDSNGKDGNGESDDLSKFDKFEQTFKGRMAGDDKETELSSDDVCKLLRFDADDDFTCICVMNPGLRIGSRIFNDGSETTYNVNGKDITIPADDFFVECSCGFNSFKQLDDSNKPYSPNCKHEKDAKRKYMLLQQILNKDKRIIFAQRTNELKIKAFHIWKGCEACLKKDECSMRIMLEGSDSISVYDENAQKMDKTLRLFCPLYDVATMWWYSNEKGEQ